MEDIESTVEENTEKTDFCEIKGQESLRRAVEIAVSGFHNPAYDRIHREQEKP